MKNNHSTNRGSALMMAIVMTLLLFIIGTAFLMSARTDTQTVAAVDDLATSDNAVQAVIGQINAVLVQDLFGTDNPSLLLNDDGGSDEPYDYPGDVDKWLADLEPYYFYDLGNADPSDDYVIWRHITDLWGNNFEPPNPNPGYSYSPWSQDIAYAYLWNSSDARSYQNVVSWDSNLPLYGRIISDEQTTETILDQGDWGVSGDVHLWGAQADADGDGVADARWVPIPNITGPRGENCYTAVRIIDNCGMININTAFRNTETLPSPEDWDGSQTTHVNLRNFCEVDLPVNDTKLNDAITMWHHFRCGWSGINPVPAVVSPTDYYNFVCRSVLNPDPGANLVTAPTIPVLFDITDELDLRHRFFLNSPFQVRVENILPKTFSPNGGKPFQPYDDPEYLDEWCINSSANGGSCGLGTGDYNRRHIATTYSFDRIITPKQDISSMPAVLKTAWDAWNNWGAANESFKPVCLEDITNANVDRLAAAIWLGLPENTEINKNKQIEDLLWRTTDGVNDPRTRIACLMACNIVDYIDSNTAPTKLTVGTDEYCGFESEAERLYISEIGFACIDKLNPPGQDPTPEKHYAIEIFNPTSNPPTNNWLIKRLDSSNSFIADYPILAAITATIPAGGTLVLSDNASATFAMASGTGITGFEFAANDTLVLMDNNGIIWDTFKIPGDLPLNAATNDTDTAEIYTSHRGTVMISDAAGDGLRFPAWDAATPFGNTPTGPASLGPFVPSNDTTPILTKHAQKINTIAEMTQAFYVGSIFESGVYEAMPVFFGRFPTLAIDSGRLNCSDPIAQGIFRYVTVKNFNPSYDFEIPSGTATPLDNDGDGIANEATELALAGRINLNTAPWFIIKQLPWLGKWYNPSTTNFEETDKLAQAIVAYRDKLDIKSSDPTGPDYQTNYISGPSPAESRKRGMGLNESDPREIREDLGFASIGELLNVTQNITSGSEGYNSNVTTAEYDFRMFTFTGGYDNTTAMQINPDPFYGTFDTDTAQDDLLERDILLHRVSNLATVRSDVFTAYIAVRIGEAGPIRRVMAIFDRSNVFSASDTPRLVALQPVADPD